MGRDGRWPCVMRRHVGKGIQGACAPMAERCGGRFAAPGGGCGSSGWSNRRSRSTRSTRRGSLTLALFLGAVRCVSSARFMAAICLPGEVRRPVPGYYLPGGALGVLSVGADASLRATHCFNIAWISCSSDSWICASQHSSLRKRLH